MNENTKKCPFCTEEIKKDAIKCRHCGEFIKSEISKNFNTLKKKKTIPIIWIIVVLTIVGFLYSIGNSKSDSSKKDTSIEKSYQNPPMFVLTELNGRELEEYAYFTIKFDNTFELKTGDGAIFNYIPTQHVGSDSLCNIVATDDRGRNTAICIKKLSGNNAMIMLENNEMISNFKGFRK